VEPAELPEIVENFRGISISPRAAARATLARGKADMKLNE